MTTLKPRLLNHYAYDCNTFIETGTAKGEGVQLAIAHGFTDIFSIEANPDTWRAANERFISVPNVQILLGDSRVVLPDLLHGIDGKACFWLDAHWSTGEPELGNGVSKCPLLDELTQIGKHHNKNHTIMIDDIRYFRRSGLPKWGCILLADILDAIMQINRRYCARLEDTDFPLDALIAWIHD